MNFAISAECQGPRASCLFLLLWRCDETAELRNGNLQCVFGN